MAVCQILVIKFAMLTSQLKPQPSRILLKSRKFAPNAAEKPKAISGGKIKYKKDMIVISNQILIDFLRLNNRALDIPNDQLGKQLDKFIKELGGNQRDRISAGRENEAGDYFGNPKTSMSYDFPENQLQNLFINLLNSIL